MYCPLYFGAEIIPTSLAFVLFDPVRSAEPPINSGIKALILLITISDDCLVATEIGSLINSLEKIDVKLGIIVIRNANDLRVIYRFNIVSNKKILTTQLCTYLSKMQLVFDKQTP